MAGLTSTGITIKSVDEILDDIESDELATIDPNLNTEADGVLGQLNGIYAAALAECWELLEEIYQSAYPDTASGQSLSYVAALTGAIRRAATKAELNVRIFGTVGTVIPAGTRIYVEDDPESEFEVTADVTVLEQGVFDYVDTTIIAVTEGSRTTFSTADTLVLATPITGVSSVLHNGATAFTEGLDEETDTQLRQRREQTLALPGASTVEAIRADMLQVRGVDSCTVFENPTSEIDINGVPPYAIEVLVFSSGAPNYTAQAIVDQIWASKPAGTQTYGSLSGTATDSLGNTHTIYYSEPTTIQTYVALTLTKTTDGTYIGDANVEQAIADWAIRNLTVGQSVYASDIIDVVAGLTGVEWVDVSTVAVDDIPVPVSANLILTARQLATIAAADVTVTSL